MRLCFIRGAAKGLALIAFGFLLFFPAVGKEAKMKDLTDMVSSKRTLSKFAQLLVAADLASFTSSRGPLTLFVPTDSAFTRIPPEEFAALLRPENKAVLQRIVLFHLINGQRLSEKDLAPLKTLPSCEGSPLPLRVNRAGYQIVGKAKILEADIRCLNGLLHEIDVVLLPPGVNLSALAGLPPVGRARFGSAARRRSRNQCAAGRDQRDCPPNEPNYQHPALLACHQRSACRAVRALINFPSSSDLRMALSFLDVLGAVACDGDRFPTNPLFKSL